ncbi:MAG: LexA family transcriptional regulator, partial [Hyphomicrobiaceae bacterium]
MAHDEPHHRLRKAREMAGYASAAAAAEAMGIKASTYTHHENGTREFSRQDATLYARKFKVRPAWLMFDEPEATGDRAKKIREVDIRAGAGGPGVESVALLETTNGVTLAADAVAATWEMPDSFLRGQLRINPERAWVVEVVGDSGYDPANPNAPGSLFPGDRAIIDTGDVRPSPAGHFAVFDGMGLVIKMVEVIAGSDPLRLRLVSRNPLYNPYEVTLDEAK